MSSFAPEGICNLCSGKIATEFIAKNTTLPALSKKYSECISKEYNVIEPELFEEAAEQYILMLNELEVGDESFSEFTDGDFRRIANEIQKESILPSVDPFQ